MQYSGKRFLLLSTLSVLASDLCAATFTVTRVDDPVANGCLAQDCSLREAVIAANATAAADTIVLASATYTLTRQCSADAATCLDLDIVQPLTIIGTGKSTTIIENGIPGNASPTLVDHGQTRILDVSNAPVALRSLTLRSGRLDASSASAKGGCLRASASNMTLELVRVTECDVIGPMGGGGGCQLTAVVWS